MARPKTENLTPLELEIMHVLWETGPANVQTVQQKLKRDLAYTTLSIKQIALDLGFGDAGYFTRFFQRLSGRTPTQWRLQASAARV